MPRRISPRESLRQHLAMLRTEQAGAPRGGGLLGPANPEAPARGSYAQLVVRAIGRAWALRY